MLHNEWIKYEVTKVSATQPPGMEFFGKLNYLGDLFLKKINLKEKGRVLGKEKYLFISISSYCLSNTTCTLQVHHL